MKKNIDDIFRNIFSPTYMYKCIYNGFCVGFKTISHALSAVHESQSATGDIKMNREYTWIIVNHFCKENIYQPK